MADVQAFTSWDTTASNNQPGGSTTIGSGLDDNLREIQAQVRGWLSYKGADLTAAATVDVGASQGSVHDITGTTTITGFGSTAPLGFEVTLQFDAATPLKHNATSLILPTSSNITAAAGDVASFVHYSSGNWFCSSYQRKSGSPLTGTSAVTQGTETATTSGTSVDFTGIPSGTKMIVVSLFGLSTNGTSIPMLQIGDSGGIETTGYVGYTNGTWSTGAHITAGWGSTIIIGGIITLVRNDSAGTEWSISVVTGYSGYEGGGYKTLTGELDRIRLTTIGGTETFDAGSMNIIYMT